MIAMLPNFIVIGAAKCGTTSICDLLGEHPQVFMLDPKEPHFFGRDDPKKTLEWYEALFKSAEGKIAIGEGSTSYTHPNIIHQAASGITEYIPGCRLIYMVRNPIKRLESDWKMRKHEGWAEGPVNEAVKRQPTLITHGMYWQNLSVYRKLFPDKQILIVFLEDFAQNPKQELKRCFEHIHVETSVSIADADKPRNPSNKFRRDGFIARYVRQTPFFNQLKEAVPSRIFQGAKLALTRKQDLTVRWIPQVRRSVTEKLRDDSLELLEHCGKPADFWNLD
ncbi:MAG: sulfotransferase domain-containing protein [Desulfobacteraceae bacterium]|nr:sulfotransferase domain-containing protein [Desulfobacteraceae bacterium]